jgi:hypothetical protein
MPLFGMGLRSMSKKQMQAALILLLLFNCILKSIIPARLEMDGQGYDFMWYLCVFLIGAYIGKYGTWFINALQGAILYVAGVVLTFAELMALHTVYIRTGSLEHIMKISIEYNHIFPLMASIGLFEIFTNININKYRNFSGFILKIAPYTLGVYLLHENLAVRYEWQKWLGAEKIDNVPGLIVWTVVAVIVVFTAGILADMLRACFTASADKALSHLSLYRKIKDKIKSADMLFRE